MAPTSFTSEEVGHMCSCQKLSYNFMRKMKDYLNWSAIPYNEKITLTEDFIKEMKDYVDWDHLSWKYGRTWSLEFIREFADKINWNSLVQAMRRLPEDFIIEMQKYIPFDIFLMYQMNYYDETFLRSIFKIAPWAFVDGFKANTFSFSKDFLREIQDVVNPNLFVNNKIHDWNFLKEFKSYLRGHSWNTIFQSEENIDVDLVLRYKEVIYGSKEFFIQWIYRLDKKDKKKVNELKKYFCWCREHESRK